ncbi:hypothetical protein J8281_02325 [Aquimarina sp. U1-2]|uniref:hypothetical protein n=1 Tax=Aquimarina sp. U1-2 TaxID=2823141 RepID=UPI001AECF040|nr:hypothetical protein [Aquimarina sp. U1-2]MBP2831011.1 hypothetical protein [Aquimarina sp. U1-2]
MNVFSTNYIPKLCGFLAFSLLLGCATFKTQYEPEKLAKNKASLSDAHSYYLVGGLGNEPEAATLSLLKEQLQKTPNATLILLGDNVSLSTNDGIDVSAVSSLLEGFKGETLFVPGSTEWQQHNQKDLSELEEYLSSISASDNFVLPKQGCPLKQIEVNDGLDIILIDSQWYIQNWDTVEGMNKHCTDIKTRRRFVEELEGMFRDGRGKNILVAMHHPIFSNGAYAGNKAFASGGQVPLLSPFDYVGEQLIGVNPQATGAARYRSLMVQVSSLAQRYNRVTIVSGHEESQQLLKSDKVHQIISGALGDTQATNKGYGSVSAIGGRLEYEGLFTSSKTGFTKLEVANDGKVRAFFYESANPESPFVYDLYSAFAKSEPYAISSKTVNATTKAAILEPKDTIKSGMYKFFWGKNHRGVYAQPITAKNVLLDTLYSGLQLVKEGGGHQSRGLRLEDKQGRQYAMRGLEKEGLRFLQYQIKGIAYNPESFEDTGVEKFVSDFFTTSHPYMQLVIPDLAKAAGINHSNTKLFYVPEQDILGGLNPLYANSLYFIEQRPSKEHKDYPGYNQVKNFFQYPITDFESTTDMLKKLREDEKYSIDQRAYIRARMFDMFIGDWDRHEDQWRWAEHELPDGKKVYVPIPRDRDGSFSKYQGLGIEFVQMIMPDTRFWQTYDEEIKSLKWFNGEVFNLDKVLLREFNLDIWRSEAEAIQQQITSSVLENSFENLPPELQQKTKDYFLPLMQERLKNLTKFAEGYCRFLSKTVVIHATDKDDRIVVERLVNGDTKVSLFRKITDTQKAPFFEQTYTPEQTKELWIYGLNDDDTFEVKGEARGKIKVRLVGGHGDEILAVSNKSKVKFYDFKHEKLSSTSSKMPQKQLSEQYDVNTFHYRYLLKSNNILYPELGFGNDKGLYAGLNNTYTKNGFNGNPYRQQHSVFARYYFDFSAVEAGVTSDFANVFTNVNLEFEAYFTSQAFARNFFGFGNDTPNLEDEFDREFNQVETQQIRFYPALKLNIFKIGPEFESYKVDRNDNRISTPDNVNPEVFESQDYLGVKAEFEYKNQNSLSYPTKGFRMNLSGGWRTNLDDSDNNFAFVEGALGIDQKLIRSEHLVLSTTIGGRANFGNNFFFYHAAQLGQNNGLRGFRINRFSGKRMFYHTSDLKLRIKEFKANIMPLTFGIYGGFDYGRVWLPGDDSNTWHHGQGGGIWLGGLNAVTLKLGYFTSDDDNMINILLGFGF